MQSIKLKIIITILGVPLLASCTSLFPKAENEYRCSVIKGEGRYGTFLNYIEGEATTVRLVKVGKMKDKDDTTTITCNADGTMSIVLVDE